MKDKIAENFLSLKAQVEEIALRHHRRPEEITIIAVSKYVERNEILKVYDCGCRDFGESRVQSAIEKMTDLPADISWHFIGRLQSNKVNKVLGRFAFIHSIDTVDLAELIASKSSSLGITASILLQVNISEEQTKQGFSSHELLKHFPYLLELKGISIQGLMTMAPLTDDEERIRKSFSGLRILRDELRTRTGDKHLLPHLSMGMSHDFPIAIAEGATLLRIGTSIFK